MEAALTEAKKAFGEGEVPVGAVIVRGGEIIAAEHNTVEADRSSVMHAEIKAITAAQKKLENWRLDGCVLYVTLEPCRMCGGAAELSRLARVVYGAPDVKGAAGAATAAGAEGNGKIPTNGGPLEAASAALLREFFRLRRK